MIDTIVELTRLGPNPIQPSRANAAVPTGHALPPAVGDGVSNRGLFKVMQRFIRLHCGCISAVKLDKIGP